MTVKRGRNDEEACHCEARSPFVARPFRVVHEAKASHYTTGNILVLILGLKYQD